MNRTTQTAISRRHANGQFRAQPLNQVYAILMLWVIISVALFSFAAITRSPEASVKHAIQQPSHTVNLGNLTITK